MVETPVTVRLESKVRVEEDPDQFRCVWLVECPEHEGCHVRLQADMVPRVRTFPEQLEAEMNLCRAIARRSLAESGCDHEPPADWPTWGSSIWPSSEATA